MRWIIIPIVCLWVSACGLAPQPERAQIVAAFEVPLSSLEDRERFLAVLRDVAADHGMHVDAATPQELERRAEVSLELRKTMSAAVWRGENDDEPIAFVMDWPDHLGQVWISFSKGENPALNSRFREAVMSEVMQIWPETLSLPIMPTGAIPLHRDLIRGPKGYVVNPAEAHKYGLPGGVETQQ